MRYRCITREDDTALSRIIRENLRKHHLDIPGTAYFDPELDHLSAYYLGASAHRFYYVAEDELGQVAGGVGMANTALFDGCAELQKLYLAESAKGAGIGYQLIDHIERKAIEFGFKTMYLETHTNLEAAIHIYERVGYVQIPRPSGVIHTTMNRFYLKSLR